MNRVGEAGDDALPLDFGLLEMDKQAHGPGGGPHIVETLGCVFGGKALRTLQLDHQHILHKEIRKILPTQCPLSMTLKEASAVTRMPRRLNSRRQARW